MRQSSSARALLRRLAFASLLCPALAYADDSTSPSSPESSKANAVAIDPVGLVAGAYAVSATHVVGSHVAIRADGQYTREAYAGLANSSTWAASLGIPIYLDRPLHGPFVELGAVTRRTLALGLTEGSESMPPAVYASPYRTVGAQGFVGWQWTFRSGLHLSYAIGLSKNWATTGGGAPQVMSEQAIRAGYAF